MIPIPPVIEDVWVYLSTTPLLWLTATLIAFLAGQWLFELAGRRPLVNPVAIAVVLLIVLLKATGTTYQTYFDGAQFVHFLLGPATVALAVPLHQNFGAVRRSFPPWQSPWPSASAWKPCGRWRRSRSRHRSPWASPRRSAASRR